VRLDIGAWFSAARNKWDGSAVAKVSIWISVMADIEI
jgi:hypothetical protein